MVGSRDATTPYRVQTVSPFLDYENAYQPHELSMFRRAYEDACFKLGIRPTPYNPADDKRTRDEIATAILYAARLGERGLAALTADAVAGGQALPARTEALDKSARSLTSPKEPMPFLGGKYDRKPSPRCTAHSKRLGAKSSV